MRVSDLPQARPASTRKVEQAGSQIAAVRHGQLTAVTGWRSWSASRMPVPQKVLGHQGVHVWLIEAESDRARQRTSSTPAAYTATHHLCPAPREQFGWSSPKPRGGLTGFYVPLRPKPLLQLGDPVAAADRVQGHGQRERGGTGPHHIDIPRSLAARAPERALCLPRRWAGHRS